MEDMVLLSVGELNDNKNHITPIRALAKLNNKNIKYLIAGKGPLKNYLKEEIKKLGLENQVKLLGYRNDIYELDKVSDIFVFPSKREGLSVALMEALACGLPVVCSNIRGNRDFISEENQECFIEKDDIESFRRIIKRLIINKEIEIKLRKCNKQTIEKCDIKKIEKLMKGIYKKLAE